MRNPSASVFLMWRFTARLNGAGADAAMAAG